MFERHKIFISYRRSGGYEIANKIENFFGEARKSDFEVFQDVKDMGKGDFKVQLKNKIQSCDTFILVLSPNALDARPENQKDWMREEIRLAVESNKTIVPLRMQGFTEPADLPEYIKSAIDNEGVNMADMNMFFEESVTDKICRLIGKQSVVVNRFASFVETGIEERWRDAEEVSLLAIGLRSVYESYFNTINEKYNNGTKFRFLTVSHKGASRKDTETVKLFSTIGTNYLKNQTKMLSEAILNAKSLYPDAKGSIEYRTFSEHMTCTIQMVKRKNISESYIFVEFWPMVARDCDRNEMPSACFHYGSPFYAYYENVYQKIWDRARKII